MVMEMEMEMGKGMGWGGDRDGNGDGVRMEMEIVMVMGTGTVLLTAWSILPGMTLLMVLEMDSSSARVRFCSSRCRASRSR